MDFFLYLITLKINLSKGKIEARYYEIITNAKLNYDINRAKMKGRNIRYSVFLKLHMKWHII